MSKCRSCGAKLSAGSAFCDQCGTRVRGDDVDGYNKPVRGDDVDGYDSGVVAQITPMTGLITPDPENPTGQDSRAEPTLEPGQTFASRYKIERIIGRGGMGVVYKSIDTISGKPTALKLINTNRVNGEKALQRLIEEGVIARDIRHPNVVAVYDVGLSEGQAFVAMEYLDGISLREWHGRIAQRGEFVPLRVSARIIVEILDGLRAAHEAGVIHRDLKPENIVLLQEPTEKSAPLKLLDFGIARAMGTPSASTTSTGLGTREYMAPEQQTTPDAVGPSADLYALSIMLYELVVNVVPGRHWQPPSGGRSDVPHEVDALILRGMSDNRNLRPQSAEQYRKELVAAVNRVPLPPEHTKKDDAPSPLNGKVIAWIIGASCAALLAIIGIVVALSNPGTGPGPGPGPAPSNPYAYYSGEWADGYGGYYDINVRPDGSFTGSGSGADGTPVNIRGGISGNSMQYTLNVRGQDLATGRGVMADACHFNYKTFDMYGNLNLSGQFHVNHEPGAPCP
jgi:serine/threonine protein kinase